MNREYALQLEQTCTVGLDIRNQKELRMNIAINLKKQATLNTMSISDEDKKSEYAWYKH